MAEETDIDLGSYLDKNVTTDNELPEIKPKKLTYYYPETPERTRAAGLSYSMEGGIKGGPGFSDLDLRNHTLEKFKAGESNFVAVAMPGKPTGDAFRMIVEGTPIIAKNVDTGGGLHGSHIDIATSNPDLARGGGYGGGGGGGGGGAGMLARPVEPISLPDVMPKEEPEEKKKRGIQMPSFGGGGGGAQLYRVNMLAMPKMEIPTPAPSAVIGDQIGPQIPQQEYPLSGQLQQQELPALGQATPTASPDNFSQAVQQAVTQPEQGALMAANDVDLGAYLAKAAVTPSATPVETPPPVAMQMPQQDVDLGAYLARQSPSPTQAATLPSPPPTAQAQPQYGISSTAAVTPTPTQTPTPDIDLGQYLAQQTSSKELPSPTTLEEPSVSQKLVRAGAKYVGEMMPHSATDVAGAVGVPTSFDPEQIVGFVAPAMRPFTSMVHQVARRAGQVHAAEKTPAYSQERFDAGVATVLDIAGHAGALTGGVAGSRIRGAAAERPLPPVSETGVRGSGAFRRSYRLDKELGQLMDGIGASRESAAFRAEIQSRNLLDELSKGQEADLGKYLVSRRLKTVNPDHPQILPEAEMKRIESEPAIAKALDYYKKEIKPDIEGWRKRAGLTEAAAAGKEAEFISLVPTVDEPLPGSGPTSARRLSRTTVFAKPAEGFAKQYNTNIRDVLDRSYSEAIRKARIREFYKAAKDKDLAGVSKIFTPEGEWKSVVQYEDLHPDLQRDLTTATVPQAAPIGMEKAGRMIQRTVTGAALTANPAELMNHMRRQLNLVAAKPPIGMGVIARLEALAPFFGPKIGAFKRAVMENGSSPEFQSVLQDIVDAGGGSTRSFGELYESKIPGLRWLQHKTTKLLFGVPKGRGINGWDLRMRVQLERIRRAAEGNADPQRIREFANQIGEYGSHTSWLVQGLKKVNPYAATTLPMRGTELKTFVGASGLKGQGNVASLRVGETFLRGTGGTLLALASANYALSGKWPWENDKGHEFDLNTGVKNKNGQTIYVKLRAIAPEMSRPISTLSIPELSRESTAKHPQYGAAAAVGPLNQALSLISGPAQNMALTAASGKVPYFLKRPGEGAELLDIAKLKKGEAAQGVSRLQRQITMAIGSVNPALSKIFGDNFHVEVPEGLEYLEEPIYGVKPFGEVFSTSYEKKSKKGFYLGK